MEIKYNYRKYIGLYVWSISFLWGFKLILQNPMASITIWVYLGMAIGCFLASGVKLKSHQQKATPEASKEER